MSSDQFHGKPLQNLLKMIHQLKKHRYSDIPEAVTQRALNSFTLQPPTISPIQQDLVGLLVYPQNPFISEPELRRLPAHDVQIGLSNSRVRMRDSRNITTQPDADGNYLYPPGTPEFDQVNAFYYTTFTLRMFERYANREIPWSFASPRIMVDPNLGDEANAFYSEQDQLLGFHTYTTSNQEERSTAQSADIVSHETAHAVLDGIRDLYNESFGLGARAFHESFGDITAILVALHDDSLIQRLLSWTDGNLRTSNFVSEIAEQLAASLYDDKHISEHTIYLRNAFNMLTARDFDTLRYIPDNPIIELGRQEHNYSRLFTGAVYDIFGGIYEIFLNDHHNVIAIHRARDVLGYLITLGIELAPVGELTFSDMALAVLSADEISCGGCYRDVLSDVFIQRGILTSPMIEAHLTDLANLPMLSLPTSINTALSAAQFLEDHILPALKLTPEHELIPLTTYRNNKGYAFMTFFESQNMQLSGDEYGAFDGANVDIFGGLSLMFDQEDRLRSAYYRPVLPEDRRQIKIIIAELLAYNRIANNIHPVAQPIRPLPEGLHLSYDDMLSPRLVKYPVIYDDFPEPNAPLADYFSIIPFSDQ